MLRSISRLLSSAGFIILTVLMILGAKYAPDTVFSFYPDFSAKAMTALSNLSSFVPFTLWELILALLLLCFLVSFIRALRNARFGRWLMGVVLAVSVGVFFYVGLWGLNYYAPSMNSRMGLPEKEYTAAELKEATLYYRDMVNRAVRDTDRDEDGFFLCADFEEMAEEAGQSFVPLSQDYSCFRGSTARVKYLLSGPLMAKTGTTGVFLCLTGESGVSKLTYEVSLPFTMCHEAAHRLGFAREDEANFAAFLACTESSRSDFRYSGYYNAFLYCYNALYSADPESAKEVWAGLSDTVKEDLSRGRTHYASLQSESVSKVTAAVYDSYLKTFSVKEGTASYGMVTDLLLVWYFEELS